MSGGKERQDPSDQATSDGTPEELGARSIFVAPGSAGARLGWPISDTHVAPARDRT